MIDRMQMRQKAKARGDGYYALLSPRHSDFRSLLLLSVWLERFAGACHYAERCTLRLLARSRTSKRLL